MDIGALARTDDETASPGQHRAVSMPRVRAMSLRRSDRGREQKQPGETWRAAYAEEEQL
jgi:hypothetical protein